MGTVSKINQIVTVLQSGDKLETQGQTRLTFSVSLDGREGTVAVETTGINNSGNLPASHAESGAPVNSRLASVIVTVGGSD